MCDFEPFGRCVKILASLMVTLNSIKIFFVCCLLLCQSCAFWQSKTEAPTLPAPLSAEELKSEIPFSTKEPERFQTEIVIRVAGGAEEKFFAAKNETNRLIVFDYQENDETAVLQTGENQKISIAHSRKIYAESQPGGTDSQSDSLIDFLTADLLNRKRAANFEALGAENNLAKYRVRLDGAQKSEIIIYVDEKIGLPVKQEFYSADGEQKKLTLTVELKNFSLQPETSVFELPKDYRKVSLKEFFEIVRRERAK